MPLDTASPGLGLGDEDGCTYILAEGRWCGDPTKRGSSFCAKHHEICYLPRGSSAERARSDEIEAIAGKVGGRRSGRGGPSLTFLASLERWCASRGEVMMGAQERTMGAQERQWYRDLGRNIAACRTAKSMRQKDLAAALSLPPSIMGGYETGRQAMGVDRLQEIADVLGVTSISLLPSR